jgi:hypothetical protein
VYCFYYQFYRHHHHHHDGGKKLLWNVGHYRPYQIITQPSSYNQTPSHISGFGCNGTYSLSELSIN